MRKKEITLSEQAAREAEELCRINELAEEFEREIEEESDAERQPKADCIKKNVKKIREEKKKGNEVAKPTKKLPEKKKKKTEELRRLQS